MEMARRISYLQAQMQKIIIQNCYLPLTAVPLVWTFQGKHYNPPISALNKARIFWQLISIKMVLRIYSLEKAMVPLNSGRIKVPQVNSITRWKMEVIMVLAPALKDKAPRWQQEILMLMEEVILSWQIKKDSFLSMETFEHKTPMWNR